MSSRPKGPHRTDSAVAIERFDARPRGAEALAQIDRIFFSSSATRSFESDEHRRLFRERWLGRYLTREPQHAYLALARSGEGQDAVVGYLVGSFEDPAEARGAEGLAYFRDFAHVTPHYPAELHVNLDPEWRGHGVGRRLVAAFLEAAREAGAGGAHVVTSRGQDNVGFYEAIGFVEVAATDWNGRTLVLLGVRLDETPLKRP